jgi:meso-butanediol dehydrogenase / (S,S)-butanediol dehydrogenase / diacetyl reductase
MRLTRRVALITGGASGIGRAISLAFGAEGAAVVIGDLDEAGARRVADDIVGAGGRASAIRVDVTQSTEVGEFVQHAIDRFGRADVLVNNAGYCQVKPILEITDEELDRMYAVHVRGTFLCSQVVARTMIANRHGRIINIVSGGGSGASPMTSHYQSAKAAQASLGRSMALAFGQYGITVNNVSPGLVQTPLWEKLDADYQRSLGKTAAQEIAERNARNPLGRSIDADEIARVVIFLALDESAAINGQVINVTGSI